MTWLAHVMGHMATKFNEDKIKIVCSMTGRVGRGKDMGYGSEIKEKDASCFVKSKVTKEKMPPHRILQIDRAFFDVFTTRATGFHRRAKRFELNFILETLSSGQNHPHSQSINSVPRP